MKKEKFLSKPIDTPTAIFLYSAFIFLIIVIFLANYFMLSFATLLNFALSTDKLSTRTIENGAKLAESIASEGAVLLKNENSTNGEKILPLKNKKVTLLGKTSVDFVYGGTGSAGIDISIVVDLKTAFEREGIQVNPTVWNAYKNLAGEYKRAVPPILGPGCYAVNEVPYNRVENLVQEAATSNYNDCAIVVLGRSGGEGQDLPNSYLYLTDREKDLLRGACDAFNDVIVLINANNTLQLRWLEDGKGKLVQENFNGSDTNVVQVQGVTEILTSAQKDKIKGAVWMGATGIYGLLGLAKVMSGKVNPSGRLSDTWAYDVMSAPAANYIGSASYSADAIGTAPLSNNYNINHEGIYIGYRYYESRYYDLKKNNANSSNSLTGITGATSSSWSYDDKELGVQYPFGYGLSYTTFKYELQSVNYNNNNPDKITAEVKVTNTGTVAGKTTVQLYVQIPQNNLGNGIEKAAVQLVGIAKTDSIAPKQEVTATISVDVKDIRYYDKTSNGSFKVDTGDYKFTTGSKEQTTTNGKIEQNNTVHAAIDEILSTNANSNTKILNLDNTKVDQMKKRFAMGLDGTTIANKFTGVDNYGDIKKYDSNYKYATRKDWTSFKINIGKESDSTKSIATMHPTNVEQLKHDMTPETAVNTLRTQLAEKHPEWTTEKAVFGAKTNATVFSILGTKGYVETIRVEKEDDLTTLAKAVTYSEATKLVRMAGYATESIKSIGLPATEDKDGPSGLTNELFGTSRNGTAFPAQIVVAATCNEELAASIGKQVAIEAKELKMSGWYAPGVNLHRSALGGRNFEYYSEDSVLSGILGAKTVKGAVDGGVIVFLKHFAMNDIETNRIGLSVWADEQTMREIYFSAFEKVIVDGKCNAVMTSFTRIGTRWCGHSYEFLTEILRGEWGMDGMVLTDYAGSPDFAVYLDIEGGILAGNDLWLNTVNTLYTKIQKSSYRNDALFSNALQQAVKNVIYTVGTSNAMHADMGLVNHATGKVIERILPWQVMLLIGTIVLLLFAGAGISYTTVRIVQTKNR